MESQYFNINNQNSEFSEEVLAQARLMSAREKFWTPSIEKLLRKWKLNISLRQKGHHKKEKKYNVLFYIFSVPNILISAGLTSSIFASYSSTSPEFQIFLGILSMISTFLVSYMTLMKYAESAALHKSTADDYQVLSNDIELITKLPKLQRGDPVVFIKDIMSRFNDIEKNALDISSKYKKDLDYEVANSNGNSDSNKKSKTIKAPKASDIFSSGNEDIKTDRLTELLISNMEEVEREKEETQKNIDNKNDYDTDDDEKHVTLAIDPESLIPGENTLKSDYYTTMKDALKKTLNWDLNGYYNKGGDDYVSNTGINDSKLNYVSKAQLLQKGNDSPRSKTQLFPPKNTNDSPRGGSKINRGSKISTPRNNADIPLSPRNNTDSPLSPRNNTDIPLSPLSVKNKPKKTKLKHSKNLNSSSPEDDEMNHLKISSNISGDNSIKDINENL